MNKENVSSIIMTLNKLSKLELLEKCGTFGIIKCKSKTKTQLIELLENAIKKEKEDEKGDEEKDEKGDGDDDEETGDGDDDEETEKGDGDEETEKGDGDEEKEDKKGDGDGEKGNEEKGEENKIIKETTIKLNPTFIEVCSGGGGLSSGLIKSGFIPLLLNDNNKDCCKTLTQNHPGVPIICGSMDEIDYTPYIGKVDLLTGGVPCQSFSQAGLRKGLNDPRGNLMMKFVDILNILKPTIFMIENVKGLLTHDKGKTIQTIINALNVHNHYTIYYQCLDASNYNVPQKRERVFIVGIIKTNPYLFEFPIKQVHRKVLKDVLYNVPLSDGLKYNEEKIQLFKMIPPGGCWVNLPEDIQQAYLGKSFHSGGGKRGILYRLSMEKPSLTLLCTPSQKQTERCHPLEERPLTIREYARIQTFDDTYHFTGSIHSQYKQIGNAVPVELARHMGYSLRKMLVL
jgi:DNA (cytosine-5)-methyltransferase 1